MENFNDYKYKRLDFEETKEKLDSLIDNFKHANSESECISYFKSIIDIQNEIEELADYADIRNMRDDKDEFFSKEMDYWNETKPKIDALFNDFYKAILNNKYLDELKKIAPLNFFNIIEYKLRIANDSIIELEQREKQLVKEYRDIIRTKFVYNGEEVSLSSFSKYFNSADVKVRKDAHDAYNDFFYSHMNKLDNIISELVEIRNKIANLCGFKDYSEYSIYKLKRFGYDYDDIKIFRDGIKKYYIPICDELKKIQKHNLGVDILHYYDTIFFKEPISIKYYGEELLNKFIEIFYNIDDTLGKFYESSVKNNYIDLLHSNDKVGFGITNYLSKMGFPTITGNYRDTEYDIHLTLHETGHGYQKLNASKLDKSYVVSSLLKYPTFDVAEMFSNAMELIGIDYVGLLFDAENYEKYKYLVYKDIITKLPSIALVDEFQETIYKEYLSGVDIRKKWIELAHKYGQDINNTGHINLDSGGYFYRISHIFTDPFYYIDYALSYFGAIAIYSKSQDNLDTFNSAARVASYYPLKTILDKYSIPNPFDDDSIKDMSEMLQKKLNLK